ncbi:MAG: flavodoxin [Bacteroidota bacterium]|nr:flavodoxin [Bacteroidota bacterium]
MMKKIGLFYGPIGGATEKIAKKIADALGNENVDIINVKTAKASDIEKYENIIMGISTIGKETWEADNVSNDWDVFFPELDKIDYSNKSIAMFGLGNHISYSLHFVDALGILAKNILPKGANIVGRIGLEGYDFKESKAVFDNKFIGLPIDEDFENNLTDKRISDWVEQLKNELK